MKYRRTFYNSQTLIVLFTDEVELDNVELTKMSPNKTPRDIIQEWNDLANQSPFKRKWKFTLIK